MGYQRLDLKRRYQIEAFLESGLGVRQIALRLRVSPSSVSREIRRIPGVYNAQQAQENAAKTSLARSTRRRKIQGKVEKAVRSKLLLDWSPEQIAGRMKLKRATEELSHQSIYRYLVRDKKAGGTLWKHLRTLRKQRKDRTKVGWKPHPEPLKERCLIEERPKCVEKRKRLGDVERDMVLGKLNGPLLLTIVDRKSRLVRIQWVAKKSSHLVHDATVRALKNSKVFTITNDNGTEFSQHKKTAHSLKATVYFSRAYRAWERGTNENTNGLIRQYFPRKTEIGIQSRAAIQRIEKRLNARPRKCLGYRTPFEIHNRT